MIVMRRTGTSWRIGAAGVWALMALWWGLMWLTPAARADTLVIREAIVTQEAPEGRISRPVLLNVSLPDDWSRRQPDFGGVLTYAVSFDLAPNGTQVPDGLLALYIDRVCTNVEVSLNGHVIGRGGRMTEPVTRNCYRPQLFTLPAALLDPSGRNALNLRVVGFPSREVAARQRAAGLSILEVGPESELRPRYEQRLFWNVTVIQLGSATLMMAALFMLGLGWVRRAQPAYLYFGGLLIGWSLISARVWASDLPLTHWASEVLISATVAPVVALAILFLQRYGGLRYRWVDLFLWAQCLLVPLTIVLVGREHLFRLMNLWLLVFAAEVAVATVDYFVKVRRTGSTDWRGIALVMVLAVLAALAEVAVQYHWLDLPNVHLVHFAMPVLLLVVGLRVVRDFGQALHAAESMRDELERLVQERTGEIERSYAQLAEMRIEQVAETERKRIAGDLHDDLGAKLLTIVHTSHDERIATLAREALEEMRLSVRGLTGKPVRVADALADWRAETVSRLSQAAVQVDWISAHETDERHLSARAYVQTTRILREAVSNIIKHSGANACTIRCVIDDTDFNLVIQDNGKGIPMELDGRLDRGHGMASMKRRAKQLAGQCLVESGPGFGTLIRLTLPL
jgi:signal transduction histidine kinase